MNMPLEESFVLWLSVILSGMLSWVADSRHSKPSHLGNMIVTHVLASYALLGCDTWLPWNEGIAAFLWFLTWMNWHDVRVMERWRAGSDPHSVEEAQFQQGLRKQLAESERHR